MTLAHVRNAERAVNCQPSFCPGNSPSRHLMCCVVNGKQSKKISTRSVRPKYLFGTSRLSDFQKYDSYQKHVYQNDEKLNMHRYTKLACQMLLFCIKSSKHMFYRLWNSFWQSEIDLLKKLWFSNFSQTMRFHEQIEVPVLPHQKSSIRHVAGWIPNFKHISGGWRTHFSDTSSEVSRFQDEDLKKKRIC